jgi:hypothetical protein
MSNLKSVIVQVKYVISLLEVIEESRDLTIIECNFKGILMDKLNQLLDQQRTYWRQRSKIKWINDGDAGTKLFHVTATLKYRNNLISQLQKDNGEIVSNHFDKAKVLWEAFKEWLRQSEFRNIVFNLSSFLGSSTDLA